MEIVVAYPPNFEEIASVLPAARTPGVIFTFGQTIFNPAAVEIGPALRSHESVHAQRQGGDPSGWWASYLHDPKFRIEEELIAHRAEYRAFRSWTKDRNAVARELDVIARRLSGPLYGGLLSHAAARRFVVVDVDQSAVAKQRRDMVAA